jgi:hypothetical protein
MRTSVSSFVRFGLTVVFISALVGACSGGSNKTSDGSMSETGPNGSDASADRMGDTLAPDAKQGPDAGADALAPDTKQGPDAGADALTPDTKQGPDTGADTLVPDTKQGPDAGADTLVPDTKPGSDSAPDTIATDAIAGFVPPMPNIAADPTLMENTDFGTSTGFKIILDYRYDTNQKMTREIRTSLRTAAASWEQFIGSDFTAIPAGTYIRARDPQSPGDGGINFTVSYPIDDLVIFVGMTDLDPNSSILGSAYRSFTNQGASAELAATLSQRYNGNPYQPWVGTICFYNQVSYFADTTMDTANDIPATQFDIYSVALHEMGHILGIGGTDTFTAMVSNATFTGTHSVALYGGPVPLTSDGKHISKSVTFDGRLTVMDESDGAGKRSLLTRLDLSMLEDLGYTIHW